MNKRTTPEAVVDELEDGMTIGIGGWGARRKPMALVRAIAASDLRELTVVSYGGPDVGLLCASGKVRKLVYGFVTLDVVPLDPFFRAARETGAVEAMELDEGMLQWGLYAASLRLPFLPTRAGLGSDVLTLNPDLELVDSPYDDDVLVAMPALTLDAAFVHVDRADAAGNGQVLGPDPYFDDLFCSAARRRFVSCERIVPSDELRQAGCEHSLLLNRAMVDGVVEAPFGAHPTSCAPAYGVDRQALDAYVAAATDEASWVRYRDHFVTVGHDAYLEAVGGQTKLADLPLTVY